MNISQTNYDYTVKIVMPPMFKGNKTATTVTT